MRKILSLLGAMALFTTTSASVVACEKNEPKPTPIPPSHIQTDLSGLPDSVTVNEVTFGDVGNFIDKLIDELQKQQEFKTLSINDIYVYKSGTTDLLQSTDIKNSYDLKIKVSAKSTSQNFIGSKDEININLTVKTDLNNLPDSLNITSVNPRDIQSFKSKLFLIIERQPGFGNFDHQADIYKKGTTDSLQPSDIVNNSKLEITVIEKKTSSNFKGQKDIEVNLQVKTDLSTLSNTTTVTLTIGNKTVINFKTKLINELQKQPNFNSLTENDVEITKDDDSILQDSDIVQGELSTKIIAKKYNQNFIGEKSINVTITIT